MTENQYVSEYGVTRVSGRGEGRDELCTAVAKPSATAPNVIEVVVDEKGPVENAGSSFGRGAAKLPAGATISKGTLIVQNAGTDAVVGLDLVKKDGTSPTTLLAPVSITADNIAYSINADLLNTRFTEDRFVKADDNARTGLKAVLLLEFI